MKEEKNMNNTLETEVSLTYNIYFWLSANAYIRWPNLFSDTGNVFFCPDANNNEQVTSKMEWITNVIGFYGTGSGNMRGKAHMKI